MSNTTENVEARSIMLEKYLQRNHAKSIVCTSIISRRIQEDSISLSFSQQQMWLLAQLIPNTTVYNECITIHIPGLVNVTALEQSLNAFIQRHEVWRTSFPVVDGQLVQMIHPSMTLPLQVMDLQSLPESERESEAIRWATEDAQKPFDLTCCPLMRITLVHLSDMDHRLFFTLHHIIFDGVAVYQVLLPELWTLYEAFSKGKPSPLLPLPIQYADFAVWQRESLQKDMLANLLAYWKQQLAGAPLVLELPTDHARPAMQTYRGLMYPFALSRCLTDALKTLSHQEGVTLYMTLAAAFQTLLYRYTKQDDLLIGTSTAGRKQADIQKQMGVFLNTVVLRTNMSGNPTFRELLAQVREVVISAYAHDELPFEYLVKELQPGRDVSRNPLVQVMLTFEPTLPALPSKWTLTQMDVETYSSKFDLTLDLDDRQEGIIGRFEYNTDLFDTSTIARMIGHWQTLLESVAHNPAQHIAELALLTEEERQQLLVDWNTTQIVSPRNLCIHQLFEEQAERTPHAIAVVYEDEQLTYQELNTRANQLAHYLRKCSVGPEVLVGLCVERSLEMVIGLLGILKAGGAYVPLDPTYPAMRIAFMLEDAQSPVLVTQQSLVTQLPDHRAKVVCLDTEIAVLAQQSEVNPVPATTTENLAYVIYTSGSTGQPKGVQIPHRAVVNFLLSMRQQPRLTTEDTLLAVTTLSFDIAALEIFLPLIVGARLVVAGRNVVANGEALAEAMLRSRTTVMQATPVTWRMLLASGWQGDQQLKVLCGGEALPRELAQQLLPKVSSLWNMYGPTETTIWSTICKVELEDEVISIGRPIANTQIYLLDTQLHLVPVGVPGELYIAGDGLARGYLNRPELTVERFIPHPFSTEPGVRLYKTGDLARYRADGTVELMGRLDHQVKLRGFRIELGEIEAALEKHLAVRQAVAVVREDVPGDKRLVAYVVPQSQQSPTSHELRHSLQEHLPDYMVPSTFILLETLPLTPNGKVDRRALPAPHRDRSERDDTFVAPTLSIHHHLTHIWEDLLDVRPIGIRDNFFDLGGHSIIAIRLVNRIEQVLGKRIPLSTLYTRPTIEQFASAFMQQVNEEEATDSRTPLVAVRTGGSKRPFFFLHGNWFGTAFYCFPLADNLGPDQPFYVLDPYKFDGLQTPPTLESMAAAHIEALRAVQSEGPYLLGGFCNGGLMAYEIARQLHAQGQRVELLVLMDPMALSHSYPIYQKLLRSAISHVGGLLRLSPYKQLSYFVRIRHLLRTSYNYLQGLGLRHKKLKNVENLITGEKVEVMHRRSKIHLALPQLASMFLTDEAVPQDYGGILDWVGLGYRSQSTYPGKITFFWPGDERWHSRSWRQVSEVAEVEQHFVPGTQLTWKTEHLHDLSVCLQECLSKVQEVVVSSEA